MCEVQTVKGVKLYNFTVERAWLFFLKGIVECLLQGFVLSITTPSCKKGPREPEPL